MGKTMVCGGVLGEKWDIGGELLIWKVLERWVKGGESIGKWDGKAATGYQMTSDRSLLFKVEA